MVPWFLQSPLSVSISLCVFLSLSLSLHFPFVHPPLPLHGDTCTHARTKRAFSRARDRSPSSYLTALVRPAGEAEKTGIIEKLEPAAAAAGSSEPLVEHARERPRRILLRNTRR